MFTTREVSQKRLIIIYKSDLELVIRSRSFSLRNLWHHLIIIIISFQS